MGGTIAPSSIPTTRLPPTFVQYPNTSVQYSLSTISATPRKHGVYYQISHNETHRSPADGGALTRGMFCTCGPHAIGCKENGRSAPEGLSIQESLIPRRQNVVSHRFRDCPFMSVCWRDTPIQPTALWLFQCRRDNLRSSRSRYGTRSPYPSAHRLSPIEVAVQNNYHFESSSVPSQQM